MKKSNLSHFDLALLTIIFTVMPNLAIASGKTQCGLEIGANSPEAVFLEFGSVQLRPLASPKEIRKAIRIMRHRQIRAVTPMAGRRELRAIFRESLHSFSAFSDALDENEEAFDISLGIFFDGELVGVEQLFYLPINPIESLSRLLTGKSPGKWVSRSTHLHPDFWGMGIAKTTNILMINKAFEVLPIAGIYSEIESDNQRSIGLRRRMGFGRSGITGTTENSQFWQLSRQDWSRLRQSESYTLRNPLDI
ncbi:MAG: GNAT family N-acetyltransferase [Bdellovibrionales bacterium]|nr:GNAT family N-acetyltransferase [Bdellovibrionales bacterium]